MVGDITREGVVCLWLGLKPDGKEGNSETMLGATKFYF